MTDGAVLELRAVEGFYGESQVLHGIDLAVPRGEIVTLIGRNGAGKTTTLRAIMGILRKRRGSLRVMGRETVAWPPERIARLGVGYVPEERGIFASLNVIENLLLPPRLKPGGMSLDEIYALFPESERAFREQRRQAFRRRAANAGDRARARAPAPISSCSTSRRRAWRPSSSRRSASRSMPSAGAA